MTPFRIAIIAALVLSGACYVLAVWQRWRVLGRDDLRAPAWPAWAGFLALTAALVADLFIDPARDLAHAVLGLWAGAAALHLAVGWLTGGGAVLLLIPVGALAVLAGLVAAMPRPEAGAEPATATRVVAIAHMACMALHVGAALVAGSAGGLWRLAARQLKRPSPRALALPPLPRLERLAERALVASAALLTAGLACGGAAMEGAQAVALVHPSVAAAGLNLLLMCTALTLRATGRLGARGLALASVHGMALALVCTAALVLVAHA